MTRKKIIEETSEILSVDQVFNFLEFAQAAYSGQFPGVYTPQLVNSRLKDVGLSPQVATADKINKALTNPKNSEQELIGYNEWMELNSMLFKRMLGYFSGLMSFNWQYVCTNAKTKDYSSAAYEKDLDLIKEFVDKFDVKEQFRITMKQMVRNEAYFGVLRQDFENYVLQELPQDRCIITGRSPQNLMFDFDMYWFVNPSVSLSMYPPVFTKMYNDVMFKNGERLYNPAASMDMRSGTFSLWHQTSPEDGFTCFKIAPEQATRVPMLSPLMPNAVLEPIIRELQTNSYIQQASKIIFGEVPRLKDAGAKLKDQIAISSENLGKFLSLVQAALPSAIKVAAAPLENSAVMQFNGSDTIYGSYLQTGAASSGINSRLLYSVDRQNMLETKLSMDIDQNILRPVYSQYQNWLAFHTNRKTKKFKFKYLFDGFETSTDREEKFNNVNALADKGIVLEQAFGNLMGLNPFDFRRLIDEARENKFVDRLTPIVSAFQMSGADKGGRPQKADNEISDEGEQTKSSGGNLGRGGK